MSTTATKIECPTHPTYSVEQVIRQALAEDAGDRGDVTTQAVVPPGTQAVAKFLAKADGVLAGLAVADKVFHIVDPKLSVRWSKQDGDRVTHGDLFGEVTGDAASILVGERVALNFMQRMSGIATATAALVDAVAGTPAKILETRKTAPGLRLLDKWGVALGGGCNHRMGLYDMIMIKDNHIAAAGGIKQAVAAAEAWISAQGLSTMVIEVETSTLDQVDQVCGLLDAGVAPHVGRIMLDNMVRRDPTSPGGVDTWLLQEAVGRIKGRVATEASGNVTLASVRPIAATGVTYISVGALTHSVTALDISLNIETQRRGA